MELTPATKITHLIKKYDFMLDYLVDYAPEFKKLRNPVMRNTVGRFATLQMAASMASMPTERLLSDLKAAIEERTGESVEVSETGTPAMDPRRLATLKGIIRELHEGAAVEQVKQRFAQLLEDVTPAEIAQMEQQLIADGLPQEEVKRLCDVHVQVFKASLERQQRPETLPGHPVHTFIAENRALERPLRQLRALLAARGDPAQLEEQLQLLGEIEKHYLRKENQLFPYLEQRGVVGPTQVMWAIHDDVRALFKAVHGALERGDGDAAAEQGLELCTTVEEMIYKEDNILYPMSLQVLQEEDWVAIRAGEGEIGYALVTPGEAWRPREVPQAARGSGLSGALPLDTGLLDLELVNLMLKSLPVDISLVDEHDEVRYYSDSKERIFPRSPGVIGRKVQNCHPPDSVATVNRILDAFRAGEEDVAEFWIQLGGRFLHIRYLALRDVEGRYRGTLEVSQDVTAIRALEGERRLLAWDA